MSQKLFRQNMSQQLIKPRATADQGVKIASKLVGTSGVKVLAEFPSAQDQNFHLKVDQQDVGLGTSRLNANGFVLKLVNSEDSERPELIEAIIEILDKLAMLGVVCPKYVRNTRMEYYTKIATLYPDEQSLSRHLVVLLEYIPGEVLALVPITTFLSYDIGSYLGSLHKAFQQINLRNPERLNRDTYILSLKNLPRMRDYLHHVENETDKSLVVNIIDTWVKLENVREGLPTGIIHGDMNTHNILVRETEQGHEVAGAIDFQGMHYAPYIYDVGIFLMYLITSAADKGLDYMDIASHALRGYMKMRDLLQQELDILYYCIAARFVQSLLFGLHNYSLYKNPYNLRTQKSGWRCLKHIWSFTSEEFINQLLYVLQEP